MGWAGLRDSERDRGGQKETPQAELEGTPDQIAYLASEPELDVGGWELARTFQKLSTERQIGMGIGPLPIRAIWEWETREGIFDSTLREHVETILMTLDALVCKRLRAEMEANRPTKENRPPVARNRR